MNPLDQQAVALAKAIRETESKNDFNAKGASGEFGAYQFMPATWSAYAKEAGVNAAFGSATPDQQNEVAYKKIKQWKDQGYNPGQIASMWNAGPGKPDAYLEGNKGVNSQGVAYDTKAYAEKVAHAYQNLKTQTQIQAKAQQVPPQSEVPRETLADKLSGRLSDAAEGITKPGLIRTPLRIGGAIAGGINDLLGAGLSAITPDFIEKPVTDLIGGAVGGAMQSDIGQKATNFYQGLDPEIQRDLGDIGNIGSLVPIGKGLNLAKGAIAETAPTLLKTVAKAEGKEGLVGMAGNAAKKQLVADAVEIVAPKATAKVLKNAVKSGRVEKKGILGGIEASPDYRTIKAAEAAAGIVRKNKTLVENAGLVKDEIGNVATKLIDDIQNMEIVPILQKEDVDNLLGKVMKDISENPVMAGETAIAAKADVILNKFKSFLPEGDITAIDLLEARKKLDKWMESQQVGDVFNPNYETAKSVALRSIRQGANELVALKAPDVAVKELLQRQSALYDALDNISDKAIKEVGTKGYERLIKRHPYISGLVKGGLTAAGAGGVAGLID